jgi:hypothetical protein
LSIKLCMHKSLSCFPSLVASTTRDRSICLYAKLLDVQIRRIFMPFQEMFRVYMQICMFICKKKSCWYAPHHVNIHTNYSIVFDVDKWLI